MMDSFSYQLLSSKTYAFIWYPEIRSFDRKKKCSRRKKKRLESRYKRIVRGTFFRSRLLIMHPFNNFAWRPLTAWFLIKDQRHEIGFNLEKKKSRRETYDLETNITTHLISFLADRNLMSSSYIYVYITEFELKVNESKFTKRHTENTRFQKCIIRSNYRSNRLFVSISGEMNFKIKRTKQCTNGNAYL